MKKIFSFLILFFAFGTQSLGAVSNYNLEAVRLYNLGLEQYRKGAYSSAIDYFKSALEIQNDFCDAYYNLAVVYDYTGNSSAAISALENLLKQEPEDFAANLKLAQIYYKKADTQKALEFLNKIPPTAPEFIKAQSLRERINIENKAASQYSDKSQVAAKVVPTVKNITGINAPTGIAQDKNGNLFVASFSDNAIFKIMPNGIHQLYSKSSKINGPIGIAIDSFSNMYVANYNNNNVLKIDKYGSVSVFIEYSNKPYYLYIKEDTLYVSEQGSNTVTVRKL